MLIYDFKSKYNLYEKVLEPCGKWQLEEFLKHLK